MSAILAEFGVVIVDGQPIYRSALENLCADLTGFRLIGTFGTGRDGIAAIRESQPDIVILDLDLPDVRGLRMLRSLAEEAPYTRTLVLTAEQESSSIYNALASGAAAYLAKPYVDHATLIDALLGVANGRIVVSPELMRAIAGEMRLQAAGERINLTGRERDILRLVALGFSAPKIARELLVSQSTVKTHLRSLYEKLGVSDRAAAVAQAMKRGLVEPV